jgi:hypothetical protein
VAFARRESLAAARRIADNFAYVDVVALLRGDLPEVRRVATCAGRLPGLYPPRGRS